MKEIKLLRGQITFIDDDDYAIVSPHKWFYNNGYAVAVINKKPIHLHVFLIGKAPNGFNVDHINRNKLDNRRLNLRTIPAADNIRNRRSYLDNGNPFYEKVHTQSTKKAISEKNSKPVRQLSTAGEFIKRWDSALQVEKELGISNGNICEVLKGNRKTAGGYRWIR